MNRSETIGKLAEALAKAQGAMEHASKDKTNPHFKSAYADLASIWEAIREPLSKNGLSVVQLPRTDENARTFVDTILMHSSGEFVEATYSLAPQQATPQGFGSAITYMRRYALTGVGVAPADDDGNAATQHEAPRATPYSAAPAAPRSNGNGTLAARKWHDEAISSIRAFETEADIAAWEERNRGALRKMADADKDLHRSLMESLADAYERVSRQAAE